MAATDRARLITEAIGLLHLALVSPASAGSILVAAQAKVKAAREAE
jgi:hypothetical protein